MCQSLSVCATRREPLIPFNDVFGTIVRGRILFVWHHCHLCLCFFRTGYIEEVSTSWDFIDASHKLRGRTVDIDSSIKETLDKKAKLLVRASWFLILVSKVRTFQISQGFGQNTDMVPVPPPFLLGFFSQVFTPHHAESLCNNVERTGTYFT